MISPFRGTDKPIYEHKTTEKLVPAKSYASAVIPYEFADDKDDIVRKRMLFHPPDILELLIAESGELPLRYSTIIASFD